MTTPFQAWLLGFTNIRYGMAGLGQLIESRGRDIRGVLNELQFHQTGLSEVSDSFAAMMAASSWSSKNDMSVTDVHKYAKVAAKFALLDSVFGPSTLVSWRAHLRSDMDFVGDVNQTEFSGVCTRIVRRSAGGCSLLDWPSLRELLSTPGNEPWKFIGYFLLINLCTI